jgi:negative regulator of flagellin synthesis FlgM
MEIKGTNPLMILNKNVLRFESSTLSDRVRNSAGEATGSDSIQLSARSREISHLNELIQSTPDVRESRVEEVRMQLDSSSYNVTADQIAEKIIKGNQLDELF